jgi:hypothetical protein
MRFINFFNQPQKASVVDEISNKPEAQMVDAPKQHISEGELYSDLLTMHMFLNYYPHVFPDQYMFK